MKDRSDRPDYSTVEPEWHATLEKPPIHLTDETTSADIALDVEERLLAILQSYGCEPTPAGWRSLALTLLKKYEPALQLDTPVERSLAKTGPDPSGESWMNLITLNGLRKKHEGSYAKAAKELAGLLSRGAKSEKKISPASLANLPSLARSGRIVPPVSWRRAKYEKVFHIAFSEVLQRLEKP